MAAGRRGYDPKEMLRLVRSQGPGLAALAGAPARIDALEPLARAALTGEAVAVRRFLTAIGPALCKTVSKILGRRHPDLEDVLQDAAFAVMEALPSFRFECAVIHFASRVAALTALATMRKLRLREFWTPNVDPEQMDEPAAPDTPLENVLSARKRTLLRSLLAELSTPQAEVLILHSVLGYTTDEIAAASGTPVNTVWSRLRLAKEALRRKVVEDPSLVEALGVPR